MCVCGVTAKDWGEEIETNYRHLETGCQLSPTQCKWQSILMAGHWQEFLTPYCSMQEQRFSSRLREE